MLATDNWCIKVSEKTYGPYTGDQMAHFAREGRLVAASLVAPAGGSCWREARHYPALARFVGGVADKNARTFGRAQGGAAVSPEPRTEGEPANFLVIFDPVIGTAGRVDPHLRSLGPAFRVVENVWCLTANLSVTGIRNALSPHLRPTEPMILVDCTRGRTSWHNAAPEVHARLTKAWVKTHG